MFLDSGPCPRALWVHGALSTLLLEDARTLVTEGSFKDGRVYGAAKTRREDLRTLA